MGYIFKISDTI